MEFYKKPFWFLFHEKSYHANLTLIVAGIWSCFFLILFSLRDTTPPFLNIDEWYLNDWVNVKATFRLISKRFCFGIILVPYKTPEPPFQSSKKKNSFSWVKKTFMEQLYLSSYIEETQFVLLWFDVIFILNHGMSLSSFRSLLIISEAASS